MYKKYEGVVYFNRGLGFYCNGVYSIIREREFLGF